LAYATVAVVLLLVLLLALTGAASRREGKSVL